MNTVKTIRELRAAVALARAEGREVSLVFSAPLREAAHAEAAGVGKGTIYLRWPDKESLVVAALKGILSTALGDSNNFVNAGLEARERGIQVLEVKDDGSRDFLDGVPFLEVFIAMAAVAAVTTKIRITTSVVKLPIRSTKASPSRSQT